jgi:hypothetical protein
MVNCPISRMRLVNPVRSSFNQVIWVVKTHSGSPCLENYQPDIIPYFPCFESLSVMTSG